MDKLTESLLYQARNLVTINGITAINSRWWVQANFDGEPTLVEYSRATDSITIISTGLEG